MRCFLLAADFGLIVVVAFAGFLLKKFFEAGAQLLEGIVEGSDASVGRLGMLLKPGRQEQSDPDQSIKMRRALVPTVSEITDVSLRRF